MSESYEALSAEFIDLVRRMHRAGWAMVPAREGVTPAEERAIFAIGRAQEGGQVARPGLVAARMHATPSAVSQVLRSLEGKGLIVRGRAGGDFRAVSLQLTEEGNTLAEEAREAREEALSAMVAEVGPDEFAHFVGTLRRIVGFLEGHAPSAGSCAQGGGRPCV